jgi:plasmid maintenance system killer protein
LEIAFHPKIRRVCEDEKEAIRKLGPENAKLLKRRLEDLAAAITLEDMRNIQQAHCHELKGVRARQLAVNLKHPFRLIFEVADDPVPTLNDGDLDWKSVLSIRILEITDYH